MKCMLIFDAAATRAAVPFGALIDALRAQFIAGCTVPQRHVHGVDAPAAAMGVEGQPGGFTSLVMPAWGGDYYGIKTINIAPGNAARGLPGLHAVYLLFDATTGVPLAQIEGGVLTSMRTAAASALAASMLARPDARELLVVGAGQVARLLPLAYRAVFPAVRVTLWARRPEQARALVDELAEQGIEAHAAGDLAEAASRADIVSCATLATAPIIEGRWLKPGCHLDLIGSFTPAMVEADDDCFRGARLFVDTPEALVKSGDLLGPLARGVFSATDVCATLEALCRGQTGGRSTAHERTVFKSVGTALEDLAAAQLVLQSSAAPGA
jgi:ornithine cyclodeaminase